MAAAAAAVNGGFLCILGDLRHVSVFLFVFNCCCCYYLLWLLFLFFILFS